MVNGVVSVDIAFLSVVAYVFSIVCMDEIVFAVSLVNLIVLGFVVSGNIVSKVMIVVSGVVLVDFESTFVVANVMSIVGKVDIICAVSLVKEIVLAPVGL